MRRICESCEMGYTSTATTCPWCGCDAALSHTSDITSVMDTECYVDYWLCMFETGEVFQLAHDITLDIPGLRRALSRYRVVTFNGLHYDFPIIALALQGATTAGYRGTATAGDHGEIHIQWWDSKAQRCRTKIGYVGEDGIKPYTAYHLNASCEFEEAQP